HGDWAVRRRGRSRPGPAAMGVSVRGDEVNSGELVGPPAVPLAVPAADVPGTVADERVPSGRPSAPPLLHTLAGDWLAVDEAISRARWDAYLRETAIRCLLYDNTVAGERYLGLNALVLDRGLWTRLVDATETLGRVFRRAARAVQADRATLEEMG